MKRTLRVWEELRMILRRSRYVIGRSDPKIVYVLPSAGRRRALECQPQEVNRRPSQPARR